MSWINVGIAGASLVGGYLSSQNKGSTGGGGSSFLQNGSFALPTTGEQANQTYDQSQQALAQQQNFYNAVMAQNGLNNQNAVFNQYQGIANGTGPNPALAQLNQSTGQNVANQAALMAGQRGSSANVGLLARQAAMQGANTQQQGAGQAAALQAQQQQAALAGMGSIANNQVATQAGAVGSLNQFANANYGSTLGALANQNNVQAGLAGNSNTNSTSTMNQNNQLAANQMGNMTGAVGSAIQLIGKGGGGSGASATPSAGFDPSQFSNMAAEGGQVTQQGMQGPCSKVGQHFRKFAEGSASSTTSRIQALVSPGEQVLSSSDVSKVKSGADPLQLGQRIPGQPAFAGNDYRNDNVKASLPIGDIVIPNKVMQSADPHKAAADFIAAVLARKGLK